MTEPSIWRNFSKIICCFSGVDAGAVVGHADADVLVAAFALGGQVDASRSAGRT